MSRIILLVALCGLNALAQVVNGTIAGTVTDQAGAMVAGAKVVLANEATGFTREVTANEGGQYVASSIPTGEYVINVEHPGFQKLRRTGIKLTAADVLTVDLARLFAGIHFHPGDLALAAVGDLDCSVHHFLHHRRDVNPGAVTFDVGKDRLRRYCEGKILVDGDLLALGGHAYMLVHGSSCGW